MNIKYTFILLFIFSVFISSCSQILLKKGANKTYKNIIEEYKTTTTIEGLYTLKSIYDLIREKKIKMPIINIIKEKNQEICNGSKY